MPRPQFRLRSLFVMMAALGVGCAVVAAVRNARADSIDLRLHIIVILLSAIFVGIFLAAWK